VLRQDWLAAYNYVTDRGALALNDYAHSNDPFSKVGKTQISVEVASVIRASDDSFRVEWVERRFVDNALASTERWSAILTIVVQPPTDADRLKKNPSASTSTPSTGQRSSADAHLAVRNDSARLGSARRRTSPR
jgi:type IV secretory pathway TrbF-like protein